MTIGDLKRFPHFADKFPPLCNGGLLVTSSGDFKPFTDNDKLSAAGFRPSTGKNAPETTVLGAVFEVTLSVISSVQ